MGQRPDGPRYMRDQMHTNQPCPVDLAAELNNRQYKVIHLQTVRVLKERKTTLMYHPFRKP